jgi:peptide/nickel transport system permease protein
MSSSSILADATILAPTRTRRGRGLLRRRLPLVVGTTLIVILSLVALFSPLLTPYAYHTIFYNAILAGPSHAHILGTDGLGRDIYTRVIYSYRVSLVVAFASIGLALLIGVPIGTIAGYVGGAVDLIISRVIDIMLAFPAILLAISLIAILGQGEQVIIIAIAIIYAPILTRVLRASVLDVKNSAYVEGARARGAGQIRIMLRHVLPNSIGPTLIQAALLGAFAIQIEAALSFLGLGVQPPTPSLGYMLQENYQYITQSPWGTICPCVGIALAVLSFNLLGSGLRDLLDPRGRDQ